MDRRILAMLLFAVLILSACGSGLFGGGSGSVDLTDPAAYHRGSKALSMQFVDNAPQGVYLVPPEGTTAYISIKVQNEGAEDLKQPDAMVVLNTDQSFLTSIPNSYPVVLGGRTQTVDTGESTKLNFEAKILPLKVPTSDTVIDATACYRFNSVAILRNLCIDPDQTKNFNSKKACQQSDNKKISLGGGQGGPVGVSKIEVVPTQDDTTMHPEIIVYVKNLGNGRVFNTLETQPQELCGIGPKDDASLDEVFVLMTVGGKEFKCSPQPVMITSQGEDAYTVCKNPDYSFPVSTPSFVTTGIIDLRYNYVDSISKSITLKRLER